jgi:hypothetical protein
VNCTLRSHFPLPEGPRPCSLDPKLARREHGQNASVILSLHSARLGTGLQTLDPSSGDQEVLRDILETSHKIQHFVGSIIGRRQLDHTQQLGGAVSGKLVRGEKESMIEKKHLIIARVLRQRAEEKQIQFIDMGTDYSLSIL